MGLAEHRACSGSWGMLPSNICIFEKGNFNGSQKKWQCRCPFPVGKLSFISSKDVVIEHFFERSSSEISFEVFEKGAQNSEPQLNQICPSC